MPWTQSIDTYSNKQTINVHKNDFSMCLISACPTIFVEYTSSVYVHVVAKIWKQQQPQYISRGRHYN